MSFEAFNYLNSKAAYFEQAAWDMQAEKSAHNIDEFNDVTRLYLLEAEMYDRMADEHIPF